MKITGGPPSAGPGESSPVSKSEEKNSAFSALAEFAKSVEQQVGLRSLFGAATVIKSGLGSIAMTLETKVSNIAKQIEKFVENKFNQATATTDFKKLKESTLAHLEQKYQESVSKNDKFQMSNLMVLRGLVSTSTSISEIKSALKGEKYVLPEEVKNEAKTTVSDRLDQAKKEIKSNFSDFKNTFQALKAEGERTLSRVLNAEENKMAEALQNEALAGINIELENPNTPEEVQQQLKLAKEVINSAKNGDGTINADTIKGVLRQLNDGRAENDKIGQRFLVEDNPKPNKLSQAANHVIDLAKSKINEIKNREANKNAEAMRNEVLGEIDERIKTGNSSREIEVARVVIVNAKNAEGVNASFIKHTLQELNQGLTDKIGERFLFESTTLSSQNTAEKALGFLNDGLKFLSDRAISLKERIAPKTMLENVDKKTSDAALDPIKTEGRSRAQVVSGTSSKKVKELQSLKNEILAFQDQNFIQDLQDAADSVSLFDDFGKPLSKADYKREVLAELAKVQNREEELREETLSIVQDFINTFSDVEKRKDAFKSIDAKIRDAHYKDGRLLSIEDLHQNLDEILKSAPRGSRRESAEKAHENRLNNLVKLYANQAPRDDIRDAMKQVDIRDSIGNFRPDKEIEQQLKNILEFFK